MPAKAAKAPIRAKRTKTEIQREFDEIQEQSADAREAADPKLEEASRRHETEVRGAVEGVTKEPALLFSIRGRHSLSPFYFPRRLLRLCWF
jgi:hypothetical protein